MAWVESGVGMGASPKDHQRRGSVTQLTGREHSQRQTQSERASRPRWAKMDMGDQASGNSKAGGGRGIFHSSHRQSYVGAGMKVAEKQGLDPLESGDMQLSPGPPD